MYAHHTFTLHQRPTQKAQALLYSEKTEQICVPSKLSHSSAIWQLWQQSWLQFFPLLSANCFGPLLQKLFVGTHYKLDDWNGPG